MGFAFVFESVRNRQGINLPDSRQKSLQWHPLYWKAPHAGINYRPDLLDLVLTVCSGWRTLAQNIRF